jgi:hypothetical protein
MARRERLLRTRLGLPLGLIERVQTSPSKPAPKRARTTAGRTSPTAGGRKS